MKFIAALLSLLLLCCTSNKDLNYAEVYYPLINKAELAIIDSDYKSAIEHYDKAFRAVPRAFSKDIVNAVVCALHEEKYTLAYRLSDSIIYKGVSVDFFKSFKGFEKLRQHENWNSFLQEFGNKPTILAQKESILLNKNYNKLFERDQFYRIKEGSYQLYMDSIKVWDKRNISALRESIQLVGFPSEHRVGVDDPSQNRFPTYVIFHHYCETFFQNADTTLYNFKDDFYTAVKSGLVNPYTISYLLELQGENSFGGVVTRLSIAGTVGSESPYLVPKIDKDEIVMINKRRLIFGLEPIEDFYRKARFTLTDTIASNFIFSSYSQADHYHMNSEDDYANLLSTMVLLDSAQSPKE